MLIRLHDAGTPASSDITSETAYLSRRDVLSGALAASSLLLPGLAAAASASVSVVPAVTDDPRAPAWLRRQVLARRASAHQLPGEALTPYKHVSTYNNFYEFGTAKTDPAENAGSFVPYPWQVRIDGAVEKPGDFTLEDILKPHVLEERVYRFRCVEAWSMVVPWVGFPLGDLIKRFAPTSRAKFVVFQTLHDPKRMPGQQQSWLRWPYVESLRMDEAMHPLSLLTVGVYGRTLPAQNGAPLRLVVPWKYGFKSIKSIVRISFVEKQPRTTWGEMAPDEYGFYANVNPAVDHPRWSQKRERRLPIVFFSPDWRETLPFNGYASQVASLYRGMDLGKHF